jgi:hypothetical protein
MVIASLFVVSCSDGASECDGVIMVGNKPYKYVIGYIDGCEFRMVVPADSSVSIVPDNITYMYNNNKQQKTIIYIR